MESIRARRPQIILAAICDIVTAIRTIRGLEEFWDTIWETADIARSQTDNLKTELRKKLEELAGVQAYTQELAFSNYKTFIQTSSCSREIFSSFAETEAQLGDLLNKLPKFTAECADFQVEMQPNNATYYMHRAGQGTGHRRPPAADLPDPGQAHEPPGGAGAAPAHGDNRQEPALRGGAGVAGDTAHPVLQ